LSNPSSIIQITPVPVKIAGVNLLTVSMAYRWLMDGLLGETTQRSESPRGLEWIDLSKKG
ncbi:MAG: hypothetical protein WBA43_19705, partial [Elainellaceae cyanobacterium]